MNFIFGELPSTIIMSGCEYVDWIKKVQYQVKVQYQFNLQNHVSVAARATVNVAIKTIDELGNLVAIWWAWGCGVSLE